MTALLSLAVILERRMVQPRDTRNKLAKDKVSTIMTNMRIAIYQINADITSIIDNSNEYNGYSYITVFVDFPNFIEIVEIFVQNIDQIIETYNK
jgi:arginase family enzyme